MSQSAKEYRRLKDFSHHCAVLKQKDAMDPKTTSYSKNKFLSYYKN